MKLKKEINGEISEEYTVEDSRLYNDPTENGTVADVTEWFWEHVPLNIITTGKY